MKKLICIPLIFCFIISSVIATPYFDYKFKRDITKICPSCNYWLSCETGSMYPTIKSCNDTLIGVEPDGRKNIKIGDIIWFHGTKNQLSIYENPNVEYIVHRIVGIDYKGCYITKGDNNKVSDEYTPCYYDIKFIIKGIIYN